MRENFLPKSKRTVLNHPHRTYCKTEIGRNSGTHRKSKFQSSVVPEFERTIKPPTAHRHDFGGKGRV
jgi:hypothetical protein